MISKFDGICRYCGRTTTAMVDHYDLDSRTAFHAKCKEEEDAKPDPNQILLAARLGYRTAAEWDVILLPPEAHGDPSWWAHRGREVSLTDTCSINDVRGEQDY